MVIYVSELCPCAVELLLQLEHNRMYLLNIGSLCNIAFPIARFTCIVTSQVFVEIWMRWSIALSSAVYTGTKHFWIVFSFNLQNQLIAETDQIFWTIFNFHQLTLDYLVLYIFKYFVMYRYFYHYFNYTFNWFILKLTYLYIF